MKNKNTFFAFHRIAFLSCLFFLFPGCGEKPTPQQRKVVSQKIVVKQTESSEGSIQSQAPLVPQLAEITKEPNQLLSELNAQQFTKKADLPANESQTSEPAIPSAIANWTEEQPPSPMAYSYNPKGKIDPFQPWTPGILDAPESGNQVQKRLPLTPLEKVDLSQLKLVGVVLSASGNEALVEEITGKGFVITLGTYVGLNGGKVTEIYRDKVIIEEVVNYGISGASVRKRELNLQKPPGED